MGDWTNVVALAKDLGLPAVITAFVTILANAVLEARKRRSKAALLEWLAQPTNTDAFAGDERVLTSLSELRRSLVFERAFGLRAESELRDQLLQFANERQGTLKFEQVIAAGRWLSRSSAAFAEKKARVMRVSWRWIYPPMGVLFILLGYASFMLGVWIAVQAGTAWEALTGC